MRNPDEPIVKHPETSPSGRADTLSFGSVVAGGGLMLLVLSGATYVVGTMLGADVLLFPAGIGMLIGLIWFVVARLARVGRTI